MTTFWLLGLFLATGVCTGSVDDAECLKNPSFDAPWIEVLPECDQAAGWRRWGAWVNRHLSGPGWEARTGDGLVAYHHWQSDTADAGWYQDVSNLVGGVVYRFSVYVLWEPTCNASNVELSVENPEDGQLLGVNRFVREDFRPHWTPAWVHARIPAGQTAARFRIRCVHGFGGETAPAAGCIKFDDASVREVKR